MIIQKNLRVCYKDKYPKYCLAVQHDINNENGRDEFKTFLVYNIQV